MSAGFRVRLIKGASHRSGWLIVARDGLTVIPGPPSESDAGAVRHVGRTVTVLLGRLPAPVINTVVLVSSANRIVAAGVGPFRRGQLLRALDETGFEIHRELRWFARGKPM